MGDQMVPVVFTQVSPVISHLLYLLWHEQAVSALIIMMKLHE